MSLYSVCLETNINWIGTLRHYVEDPDTAVFATSSPWPECLGLSATYYSFLCLTKQSFAFDFEVLIYLDNKY